MEEFWREGGVEIEILVGAGEGGHSLGVKGAHLANDAVFPIHLIDIPLGISVFVLVVSGDFPARVSLKETFLA